MTSILPLSNNLYIKQIIRITEIMDLILKMKNRY